MTDDRVRFTDDQAAWSKASCVKRGYWSDEVFYTFEKKNFLIFIFIKALLKCIPKGPRRSPIIHAMYYMRHMLVDTVLNEMIISKKVNQFLILGAGTDTSFWRLNMIKHSHIKVQYKF